MSFDPLELFWSLSQSRVLAWGDKKNQLKKVSSIFLELSEHQNVVQNPGFQWNSLMIYKGNSIEILGFEQHFDVPTALKTFRHFFQRIFLSPQASTLLWRKTKNSSNGPKLIKRRRKIGMQPGFFSAQEFVQKWSESVYLLDKNILEPSDRIQDRSVAINRGCKYLPACGQKRSFLAS